MSSPIVSFPSFHGPIAIRTESIAYIETADLRDPWIDPKPKAVVYLVFGKMIGIHVSTEEAARLWLNALEGA